MRLRPAAFTAMTTSPGFGWGTGRSSTCSTSGDPYCDAVTTRMLSLSARWAPVMGACIIPSCQPRTILSIHDDFSYDRHYRQHLLRSSVMAGAQDSRGGLREVTRRAARAEIARKATDLFLERGFDETTIEQIAAAVGTSGRNVSRYFPTKEDMVLGGMLEQGYGVAGALAARPPGEAPWQALRRAFDECLDAIRSDGGRALARATMPATTPSLRAAALHKRDQWIDLLYPHVLPRVGGPAASRELRARA